MFDAYVDRTDRVWLVDVAPFGPPTDAQLYTWEELRGASPRPSGPELRIVESQLRIRPDPLAQYRFPLRDVASPEALAEFLSQVHRDTN